MLENIVTLIDTAAITPQMLRARAGWIQTDSHAQRLLDEAVDRGLLTRTRPHSTWLYRKPIAPGPAPVPQQKANVRTPDEKNFEAIREALRVKPWSLTSEVAALVHGADVLADQSRRDSVVKITYDRLCKLERAGEVVRTTGPGRKALYALKGSQP